MKLGCLAFIPGRIEIAPSEACAGDLYRYRRLTMKPGSRVFFGMLFLQLAMAVQATAQLTAIDTIQTYNPVTGAPIPYPVVGSTVTVQGTLFVLKGTFNTGSHYIQVGSGHGEHLRLTG